MCFSSPSIPAVQPVATPAKVPTPVDEGVQAARTDERKRLALLSGRASTLQTGSEGVTTEAPTQRKTLLGA
jgi:hypothetical protein